MPDPHPSVNHNRSLGTRPPNFSHPSLVISPNPLPRSILSLMGLDHVLFDFLSRAAVGAATVLLVILVVGIGIPRRATIAVRRLHR